MTGVVKDRHGTCYARRKVPKALQEAVAQVLGSDKGRQVFLKRSLGTKDIHEANIRAKPVQQQFDRIFEDARALLEERPKRERLSAVETKLLADYHFASMLASDEEETRDGTGSDELLRSIANQRDASGVKVEMPLPLDDTRPAHGMSNREVARRAADLAFELPLTREALARGDITNVSEILDYLLHVFQYNVDRGSPAYRQAGFAVLRAHVKALEHIERRSTGEPIETPALPALPSESQAGAHAGTLRAAFQGWAKERNPAAGTLAEYRRAVDQFIQMHGDMAVGQITRAHVRMFREALQDTPRNRTGKLRHATLPELAEWGRTHPEAVKLTATTVNKMLGGVQAVTVWARDKGGFISDDVAWSDPFSKMRLEGDELGREPFTTQELRAIFNDSVFTEGRRPKSGRGDAAFWLPLLGLFTGARRGELAGLSALDVQTDEATGVHVLVLKENKSRGRSLKTKGSTRTVPIHPELVRLGLKFVDAVRRARGKDGWVFPTVAPEKRGALKAWTKWFHRYIRKAGVSDTKKVFHSFRHAFKDALRAARVPEDLNDALTGHSNGGSVGRGYGARDIVHRFGMATLVDAVSKVKYQGLDLSQVRVGSTSAPS